MAEPLPTTDQNPLLASIGMPAPLPATIASGSTQVDATLNWGSTSIVEANGAELLILDAETREFRIAVTHALSSRFAIRAELPYLYTGAGMLDSFIDDFHETFGLEEGDRPLFQRDEMLARYQRSGPSLVNERSSTQGVGDLTLAIGANWLETDSSSITAWLSLGAPTASDGAYLADDDSWNGSLSIAAQHRFGTRWLTFAQAGASAHTGDGLFDRQSAVIWNGIIGGEFALTPAVAVLLQAQAHTAAIEDSDLKILGDAVILTVGGRIDAGDGVSIHLGLSEDIKVEASPDVVFVLGVSWAPR